jgi:uncharacterized protein
VISPRLIVLQPTSFCNINCSYCYLGGRDQRRIMSPVVIEAIRERILRPLPPSAEPTVVWHAGEPTTVPIEWYEHAYSRLAPAAPPLTSFIMQSNGIGIDAGWIDLFKRTNTKIGLSIDGPQRFHDDRRRTRNDRPTWRLAMRGLGRLQSAGLKPRVLTVLHPASLDCAEDYYTFYRDNNLTDVSFSIDERAGINKSSSFDRNSKAAITGFMLSLMRHAYRDGFPLHIREVERIAASVAGVARAENEQAAPWAVIAVAADGNLTTFSPDFMEVDALAYNGFVLGNILDPAPPWQRPSVVLERICREITAGIVACQAECQYFDVCGGGSPMNKFCETGSLEATETEFCVLTVQAAADALSQFVREQACNRPASISRLDTNFQDCPFEGSRER